MSGNNLRNNNVDLVQVYTRNPHSSHIIVSGNVTTTSAKHADESTTATASPEGGATFTQQSVIWVPTQREAKEVEFEFKTSHPNGIMLLGQNSPDNFRWALLDFI